MSTERDELAADIRGLGITVIDGPPVDLSEPLAQHLHNLGYRKPRTITTVRELHALATDAVIRTQFGAVFVKDGGWWAETGTRDKALSADIDLPATVLHDGSLA